MFKWILRLAALAVLTVLGLFFYGGTVPEHHVAVVSARFAQPPAAVWDALTDVTRFPEWRSDLATVEQLPAEGTHRRWRETGDFGTLTIEVVESDPPRRLATTLLFAADEGPDFTGSWIWDLRPEGTGTLVTLTEDGRIHNRIFRALAHTVMGYQSTQEKYLRDLGRRLGDEIEPLRGPVTMGD
jgi:uncharacterized protein YndB with AHSA1/START domain